METIPNHIIDESFKVAGIIRDPYFRSIAYAKMAYELYGVQNTDTRRHLQKHLRQQRR